MARLRGPRSTTTGMARAEGGPVAAGQIYDFNGPEPLLIRTPQKPDPLTYADALTEAHAIARSLGLIPGFMPLEQVWSNVADLVRATYAKGWLACESRMDSRDMADAIDGAIRTPSAVVEKLPGESVNRHVIRAIQHAVVYGVKSEPR